MLYSIASCYQMSQANMLLLLLSMVYRVGHGVCKLAHCLTMSMVYTV